MSSVSRKLIVLLFLTLAGGRLSAQDAVPVPQPAPADGGWVPLGPLPVDEAGSGRRGYVLSGESAEVTAPGGDQFSLHMIASNNFYREDNGEFLISERYETHTMALGYRRGFKLGGFPRFELGGQIQLFESDSGILNGFIRGFESMWVSVTGNQSSKNNLRTNPAAEPPLGTLVARDGRAIYQAPGDSSGFGDMYFVAKLQLKDAEPTSNAPRIAARAAVNIAGASTFTQGNFAGVGLSLDKKLFNWAAFHGDVRAHLIFDSVSAWGLPLDRTTLGFSTEFELKLSTNTSVNLRMDGATTPYLPTGADAFDQSYGDLVVGVGHRFAAGGRRLRAQLYARENMNLPDRVRWNTDPDLAVGLKATIY